MKNLFNVFWKAFAFFYLLIIFPKLILHFFSPMYIRGKIWPSLDSILLFGIAWAIPVAVVITLIQVWYVRNWARKNNIPFRTLDYGAHQQLEMEIPEPSLAVFSDLKGRLSNSRWKITYQDEQKGILKFKISYNWQMADDVVTIRLESVQPQKTIVKVDSRMNSLWAIVDSAHNLKNVQQVRQALSQ